MSGGSGGAGSLVGMKVSFDNMGVMSDYVHFSYRKKSSV